MCIHDVSMGGFLSGVSKAAECGFEENCDSSVGFGIAEKTALVS